MKVITSLLAVAVLLCGINIAAAQALPTNPPTVSEGDRHGLLFLQSGR
jgi:hypothetical protein